MRRGLGSDVGSRRLIVNADDFGASEGVNGGIVYAHDHGLVTSTSLMVRMPAAEGAAELGRKRPRLSIGLHVDLTGEGGTAPVDIADVGACEVEIRAQLDRFEYLLGRPPTHLDSHHHVHRFRSLEPLFVQIAAETGLPLREHSEVRLFPDFYGHWDDGETHPEWISPENLIRMLDDEIGPGFTELSCHPGWFDPTFESPYHRERELEVRTLCDPSVRRHVEESDLVLANYDDVRPEAGDRSRESAAAVVTSERSG
jgi:chitin disaccharide deacetylase